MITLQLLSQPRSITTDLDWLTKAVIRSKYPFPQSYLDYSQAYGYGRALGLLIMYAANEDHPDSILIQGERVTGFVHMAIDGGYMEYEPDGSQEIAEQLFPFAMSENGEYFGWALNPESLKNNSRPEYPIYCIGSRMASMRFGAENLDTLFQRLTSNDVKGILGPGYSPLPKTFQPLE